MANSKGDAGLSRTAVGFWILFASGLLFIAVLVVPRSLGIDRIDLYWVNMALAAVLALTMLGYGWLAVAAKPIQYRVALGLILVVLAVAILVLLTQSTTEEEETEMNRNITASGTMMILALARMFITWTGIAAFVLCAAAFSAVTWWLFRSTGIWQRHLWAATAILLGGAVLLCPCPDIGVVMGVWPAMAGVVLLEVSLFLTALVVRRPLPLLVHLPTCTSKNKA